jgi:hypothetical protein
MIEVRLTEREARALNAAAELLRDVLADAHIAPNENALADAHLKLVGAIERCQEVVA